MKLGPFPFFFFPLLLVSFVLCSKNPQNRFDFDFHSEWEWDQLISKAGTAKITTNIKNLKQNLSLKEATFLLRQLSLLQNPNDIRNFTEFEKLQIDLGGSFYGMLPDRFTESDSIPIPDNFENLMETAWYLTQIRRENYIALSNPAFNYKTEFILAAFTNSPPIKIPGDMKYEIDLSVITDLLELYSKDATTLEEAKRIANNTAFKEMLKHRRNLGYIPEPLPDEDDLAQFIYLSSSKESLQMLWKWINPCNYFCLADLFVNRNMYQQLVVTLLKNQESISEFVLGRIANFVANNFIFKDRLCFAVNFGIRSWATEFSLGTNLVMFKDDYDIMLRTIIHETFHRVQLQLCPVDSSRMKTKERKFEDLSYYNFPDQKDQKFYEILSYIFLEGTATFVGGATKSWNVSKNLISGKELFEQCFQAIYTDNDFKKADVLLNQGLSSNGPFYTLGYHMSKIITNKIGEKQLGRILSQGSLTFFNEFLKINESDQNNKESFFSTAINNRLKNMNAKL